MTQIKDKTILEALNIDELSEQAQFCLNQRKAIVRIVGSKKEALKEPLYVKYGQKLDQIIKEAESRGKS
jgi:hypothetical protein